MLRLSKGDHLAGDVAQEFHDVLVSVDLCKASLAAFREVRNISPVGESWAVNSFRQSIEGAASVYAARSEKEISFENGFPDSMEGYSNNYLLALMLPLLENAIEASPAGGTIYTSLQSNGEGEIGLSIENLTERPVNRQILYGPGRSSKQGHEGLGVVTVLHLLGAFSDARLVDTITDGRLSMTVYLPRR